MGSYGFVVVAVAAAAAGFAVAVAVGIACHSVASAVVAGRTAAAAEDSDQRTPGSAAAVPDWGCTCLETLLEFKLCSRCC